MKTSLRNLNRIPTIIKCHWSGRGDASMSFS